jgi:glyoxylase I family protein
MISGIEHTAIASPDPRRLAAWYVDTLGFVINYQSKNGPTTFVKAPNGSMIEIIESSGPSVASAMRDAGIRHMALAVADFTPVYEALKARGVEFLSEPEHKGGNHVVFFRDLDGNILHLLQRETPLP